MFQALYIEEEVLHHPKTEEICNRFPDVPRITCERYSEIFNRKGQNFAAQKKDPALILAKKYGNFIHETPPGYSIGGSRNYYFSHLLNCIYDCRYCFLQGMFRSAHYVFFVNFEDFKEAIEEKISLDPTYFFSGYDCDSLALEPITHFTDQFLPLFHKHKSAYLELRTKSIQIQHLLKQEPIDNCIIAYTLSPKEIAKALEHKAPSFDRRLNALVKLQNHGWPIGLRFDPLIYCDNFKEIYQTFFSTVFSQIKTLHSVTLGAFRLPKGIYKNMKQLYPKEKLFAHSLEENRNTVSYTKEKEHQLTAFCKEEILKYIPESLLFSQEV